MGTTTEIFGCFIYANHAIFRKGIKTCVIMGGMRGFLYIVPANEKAKKAKKE
jgi:hypothetical protein